MVAARLQIAIEDHRGIRTVMWWEMPCQAIPDLEKHPAACDARIASEPVSLIGLLGRDLVRLATVMYNGKKGTLEVIFDPDWIRSRDTGASVTR